MENYLKLIPVIFEELQEGNSIVNDLEYDYDIHKTRDTEFGLTVEIYDILSDNEFLFNIPVGEKDFNIKYMDKFISLEELEDKNPDYYKETTKVLYDIWEYFDNVNMIW